MVNKDEYSDNENIIATFAAHSLLQRRLVTLAFRRRIQILLLTYLLTYL